MRNTTIGENQDFPATLYIRCYDGWMFGHLSPSFAGDVLLDMEVPPAILRCPIPTNYVSPMCTPPMGGEKKRSWRDKKLRLWHPGPRHGALQDASLEKKVRQALYRRLNADTGILAGVDIFLKETLNAVHHTRERVVEYGFAFRNISIDPPAQILIAGGARSPLSYMLSSLGYEVTVVDLDPYGLSHPNLNAITADLRTLPFIDGAFDVILCVSVIEHVGHSDGGGEGYPESSALKEFGRVLQYDGQLVLTTPIADEAALLNNGRVYDIERFQSALPELFEISNLQIYSRTDEIWQPSDKDNLSPFDGYSISNVLCTRLILENL